MHDTDARHDSIHAAANLCARMRCSGVSKQTAVPGEKVSVEIELQGSNNDPRLLSGFVGESKRLQQAKEMLDGQFGTVFMDW